MPALSHQLQSCVLLSPVEFSSLTNDQQAPYPDLHCSFQPSAPREMAGFNNFENFTAFPPDHEQLQTQGNYAAHPSDEPYRDGDMTGIQYQSSTMSEEPYWPPGSGAMTQMQAFGHRYVQQPPDVFPSSWSNPSPLMTTSNTTADLNYEPYSPPGSSHSYGSHPVMQTSPDGRRSMSSELILSPYPSSVYISPTPAMGNLPYGTSAEESAYNADSHREQLRLFREALQLPMSYSAGPFVPQKMYIPSTVSDQRRYVEEIELQQPIYFWMQDPEECGIPLIDALHSRVRRLQFRDEPVFEGRGPSISVRILWPGYRAWSRQIPTKDFRSPPQPITKAKLAKNIAKCVERFLIARIGHSLEDDVDPRWKIGPRQHEIKLDDLILVSMHHVSMGSWQPHLRLRRPLPS